ncbi:MAG: hypothetical protein JNL58_22660 [Planctomyces sp.]|nr:hypothetical protein [Planctomyces sp.]
MSAAIQSHVVNLARPERIRHAADVFGDWLQSKITVGDDQSVTGHFCKDIVPTLDRLMIQEYSDLKRLPGLVSDVIDVFKDYDEHNFSTKPHDVCPEELNYSCEEPGTPFRAVTRLLHYLIDKCPEKLPNGVSDNENEAVTVEELTSYANEHPRVNSNDSISGKKIRGYLSNVSDRGGSHIIESFTPGEVRRYLFHYSRSVALLKVAKCKLKNFRSIWPSWAEFKQWRDHR